jgi:crossover junction endodeoxyribonuclease RusA
MTEQIGLWSQPNTKRVADLDPAALLTLFIPGHPKPQGSHAYKGHRAGKAVIVESSASSGQWRDRVAWAVHDAWRPRPVLAGVPLSAELVFVMPRPSSTPKTTPPAIRRPDLDKLVRTIFDALTGPVFTDDSVIVDLYACKRLAATGEPPGVHITLQHQGTRWQPPGTQAASAQVADLCK